MSQNPVVPCPICGYHAPDAGCRSCGRAPRERSLADRRGGFAREIGLGLRAILEGARTLATTPRTKRLLVPPMLLTAGIFAAILWSLYRWLAEFFAAVAEQDLERLGLSPGFWSDVVEWFAGLQLVLSIAHVGGVLVLFVAFAIAGLWTFSIAYELVCGPFLDTIQARVEARWFGADPKALLERPPGTDPAASARAAAIASAVALLAFLAFLWIEARWSWALLLAIPAAFAVATQRVPDSGPWLWWFLRSQARALWTSAKASLLAAFILVLFVWVKFVPFVGLPLFAMVAGFATALTLLDIPFSRRGYSLDQRVRFLLQHFAAVVALGVATSLVFVVPVVGPLVGVPCASIGGVWLLCRVDKDRLRPAQLRAASPAR